MSHLRLSTSLTALLSLGTAALLPATAQTVPADFEWTFPSYLKHFDADIRQSDQSPAGLEGGELIQIAADAYTIISGLRVFHDEGRIYGLQFRFANAQSEGTKSWVEVYDGQDRDDDIWSDVVGQQSGTQSLIELGPHNRLHYIRAFYGDDPRGHYNEGAMIGLSVGRFADGFKLDGSIPVGTAYDALVEERVFGTKKGSRGNSEQGYGFTVHPGQGVKTLNFCVSPHDRSGYIMMIGARVNGLNGDRTVPDQICTDRRSGAWKAQPIGHRKVAFTGDPTAFTQDEDALAAINFDPFEEMSGIYRKSDSRRNFKQVDPRSFAPEDFKWQTPEHALLLFGDQAEARHEGQFLHPQMALKSVSRSEKAGNSACSFAKGQVDGFSYSDGRHEVSVSLVKYLDRGDLDYSQPGNPAKCKTKASVDINYDYPNGRRFSGSYEELPLGGARAVARTDADGQKKYDAGQSQEGLFEIASVVKGFGYIYYGYDYLNMSLYNYEAATLDPIFVKSGPNQFHINDDLGIAVPDGLLARDFAYKDAKGKTMSMSSARSMSETVSMNFGGSVPIKGVPVGINYSSTESEKLSKNQSRMQSLTLKGGLERVIVTDKYNAFLDDRFRDSHFLKVYDGVPGAAERLVEAYGTHYPVAIGYGGRAIETRKETSWGRAVEVAKSKSLSVSIGGGSKTSDKGGGSSKSRPGPSAEAGISQQTTNTSEQSQSMSEFGFRAVGGSGGDMASFSTSEGDAVPTLYHLEPIYELMEPLMIYKALAARDMTETYDKDKAESARKALQAAVEEYVTQNREDVMPFPEISEMYQLTITNIRCIDGGDDGANDQAEMKDSTITLRFNDEGGDEELQILELVDEGVKCGSNAGTIDGFNDVQAMMIFPAGTAASGRQPASLYADLSEWDSMFEGANVIGSVGGKANNRVAWNNVLLPLPTDYEPFSAVAMWGPKAGSEIPSDAVATDDNAPSFMVDYTWQRIKF